MIYELLSTALIACSIGAGTYKEEPKSAKAPMPYIGTYTLTASHSTNDGDTYTLEAPNGETAVIAPESWDTTYTASSVNRFANLSVNQSHNSEWTHMEALIVLTFKANTDFNDERLLNSYQFMQEDQSQYVSLGAGFSIDEYNIDSHPEIHLLNEWNGPSTSSCSFTFPVVYGVTYETFATQEFGGVSWIKQGSNFSKTFNAIYVDNTEPKLYAFWIDKYMLSRQVRFNGDIINQNYVTTLDGVDPTFGKQCSIQFTPTEDVELNVSAVPYDPTWSLTNDYNRGYNNGYEAGKTEGQTPVSWIKTTFDGIAGFFNIQVFPFVTLGFLCFAPLIVVAIVAILRIIKHD